MMTNSDYNNYFYNSFIFNLYLSYKLLLNYWERYSFVIYRYDLDFYFYYCRESSFTVN
jgi:hypothetical protein